MSSNKACRRWLNGMLAIDVDSGEEWLWLSSHSQSDDVVRYMAHLALEKNHISGSQSRCPQRFI